MFDALDPDRVVIRNLLEGAARRAPGEPCAVFEDGTSWTRRQALHAAYAAADSLRGSGVTQGSVVAAALPNGEAYLRTWWGAAMLGAPVVPVNIRSSRGTRSASRSPRARPGRRSSSVSATRTARTAGR